MVRRLVLLLVDTPHSGLNCSPFLLVDHLRGDASLLRPVAGIPVASRASLHLTRDADLRDALLPPRCCSGTRTADPPGIRLSCI